MAEQNKPIVVEWLGRTPYMPVWQRQQTLAAAIAAGDEPERLLLLEHEPTYTLGRRTDPANLLLDETALRQGGFAVHHVDRGGDITYHGPGQLVGYPLLRLAERQGTAEPDLHRYLRDLEEALICTLAAWGVTAGRFPGYTGVWVAEPTPQKIAAIGVKVTGGGVTAHGFALNVAVNLAHFDHIVPCGIREYGVTSLHRLLDAPWLHCEQLIPAYCAAFTAVFGHSLVWSADPAQRPTA